MQVEKVYSKILWLPKNVHFFIDESNGCSFGDGDGCDIKEQENLNCYCHD